MTVLVASADATSATFQYTLANGDSLLVQQGITLVHSAQGTIIRASTGGHMDVQGTLFGSIRFGGISGIGTGNSVAIGAS